MAEQKPCYSKRHLNGEDVEAILNASDISEVSDMALDEEEQEDFDNDDNLADRNYYSSQIDEAEFRKELEEAWDTKRKTTSVSENNKQQKKA